MFEALLLLVPCSLPKQRKMKPLKPKKMSVVGKALLLDGYAFNTSRRRDAAGSRRLPLQQVPKVQVQGVRLVGRHGGDAHQRSPFVRSPRPTSTGDEAVQGVTQGSLPRLR